MDISSKIVKMKQYKKNVIFTEENLIEILKTAIRKKNDVL